MTNTTQALTVADIERLANDERWLGFGYIGERARNLASTDPEAPAQPLLVAAVDQRIIDHANANRWTYDELFAWANSKAGRWLADSTLGGYLGRFDSNWDRAVAQGLLNRQPTD